MSVERTLRYSSLPNESITLDDLRLFLNDADRLEFGEKMVPFVTIQNSEDRPKVGTIQHVVLEDMLD